MQPLDGLRGIAIFGVFLAHFLALDSQHPLFLPYGSVGVRLFFVLSGFLITGVLIKARDRIDDGLQSVSFTLKAFYIRRCLRLFAVFYAWLIATQLIFGGDRFWWDAFYLSNFHDIIYKGGGGNHYWSLAVEEQFYLVWPVVILLLPRKHWTTLFVSCLTVAIAVRIAMAFSGFNYLIVKKFPLTCADALAGGALLASFVCGSRPWSEVALKKFAWVTGVVGVVLFGIAIAMLKQTGAKGSIYTATLHTGLALLSMGLIAPAVNGYRGCVGAVLSSRPLCLLGKISYGCYIYHLVIREVVKKFVNVAGFEFNAMVWFAPMVVATFVFAWLSWWLLESRVNDLKKHFPMKKMAVNQL